MILHCYGTVSCRCAVCVGGKQLTYVNGKSIERGKPELWMFGGGVVTTDAGRRELESECDAERFEGDNGKPDDHPNDLRCWMPKAKVRKFETWLSRNESGFHIVEDAKRELREECVNHDLPLELALQIQFKGFKRIDQKRKTWSYQGEEISDALCYDYIVPGRVTDEVAQRIEDVVATSENLYLITLADVKRGYIEGMVNGKPSRILVPAICRLLF